MHTYEISVYREGRWWMIYVPEIDELTPCRVFLRTAQKVSGLVAMDQV